MIVIIGASASGKTELAKTLKDKYNYKKCVTTTTRNKRDGEVNGIDYHFISKDEFKNRLKLNEFVEHAIYNDNYYGINKKDINTNALVIVEPSGANELIKQLGDDAFIVFVKTKKSIRKKRMIKRGDSLESIKTRLKNDKNVFRTKNIDRVDMVIENNNHSLDELAYVLINIYENR